MRVLSIDWDYFVEEDPMLDWGHREEALFLDIIWKIRRRGHKMENGQVVEFTRDIKALAPFRGPLSLVTRLPCLKGDYAIALTESHLAILQVIKNARNLEVVNIDAHHDLFYGLPAGEHDVSASDNAVETNCGNWGSYLLSNNQIKSWLQVYPEWRKKYPELCEGQLKWAANKCGYADVVYGAPPVRWAKVDLVFVCRSGCWTPPEYDRTFTLFCRLLELDRSLPERSLE